MAVYVNNITIRTGEYFSRDFYLDNLDGSPLDLTGYSGSSQIRKHQESLNPTATFLLSFVDRVNGRIRLTLSSSTTATIKPGRYVYDILFTDPTDKKSIVIEGNVLATQDVTIDGFGSGGGGSGGGGSGGALSYTYDNYLLTYTATGITTSKGNSIITRTTVTSPDPQSASGYTGFSTVGYGYTNPYTPSYSSSTAEVPAHVGIPTYLTYGGGWYASTNSEGGFGPSAIGNDRIVVGNKYYTDYDASITGIAGTYIGAAYLYDLNGNLLTQINAPDGVSNEEFGATVEIDSNKIIIGDNYYTGTHVEQGAVYVFDMDGNFERRITLSAPNVDDYWPNAMAADNGKIFTSDYNNNVYIHNLDGTGEIKIVQDGLLNTPPYGGFGDYPIAAGNGKFVVGASEYAYIFDQDGTGEIRLSDPTSGASGTYGDAVAIGGNKIFVADPEWEDANGVYVGKIYRYDLDGTNRIDIVKDDTLDFVFELSWNGNDKQLIASEDYVWYGAQLYDSTTAGGAAYRWDIDGSNNVRIEPPAYDAGRSYYGQNLSVDKTSNKFIIGSGDNGLGEDVHLYSYAGTSNPKRLTPGFDPINDFSLLDVTNLESSNSGIQQVSLDFSAGFLNSQTPPHPFAEVSVSVTGFKGGTMKKVGGTWINANPTSSSVIGIATGTVGQTSGLKGPGTRIAVGDIDLINGTITFT